MKFNGRVIGNGQPITIKRCLEAVVTLNKKIEDRINSVKKI